MFQLCLHHFAFLMAVYNILFFINISTYFKKIFYICFFNFIAFLIPLLIVGYLDYTQLIFMILISICIQIIGGMCSLGECIFLGFLKDFDSKNIASWGVGTGLAGLIGSLIIFF